VIENVKNYVKENYILALALLVTFAVYFQFIFFAHISWDDPEMVFRNKDVQQFNAVKLFSHHYVGNYIPITMFVHSLVWVLFKNSDGAHHAINIIVHLINGILVYQICLILFKNKFYANICCIIFLLHPLQLESVGWVSELKNCLSTTFFFASLSYYIRFLNSKKQKNYLMCLVLFVAGSLSKSLVVILPLILLCIDYFTCRKINFFQIANKLPFLVVSLLLGFVNIRTQEADLFINHAHEFPFYERIGYAGFALLKYLQLFTFPVNLSVLYPYPENKTSSIVLGFIFIAALIIVTILFIKKKKNVSLSMLLSCIISLMLVLQFIPFGEVLYADRYMYVPVLFFSIFALSLFKLQPNKSAIFILMIVLASITFFRAQVWKSSTNLYADILKKFPDSFVALNSLGAQYMFENQDEKALYYLKKATTVSPKNYKGFYNSGLVYLKLNKPDMAIKNFNQSLTIYDYTKAYVGRANAYYMKGDIAKAMNEANIIINKEPLNARARFVLANCYNDLNQIDKAINEYDKCIDVDSDNADFYFKRGIAYGKKQNFLESVNDFSKCVTLDKNYYQAYYWRGVAKVNLKQNACEDFKISARNNFEPAITAYNKYCK
jgi:protein O-mannosyl-transferase